MYTELLSRLIENSGKTLTEIASLCRQNYDVRITQSYISKLRTGKQPPAMEPINRALAEVCGGDPDELQYAAFYDRSPATIRRVLRLVAQAARLGIKHVITDAEEAEDPELKQVFTSDWALFKGLEEQVLNEDTWDTFLENASSSMEFPIMNEPREFSRWRMTSEEMEPLIPASSLLHLRPLPDERNDGEIVVVKKGDDTVVRRVTMVKGEISLVPYNPKYSAILFDNTDMQMVARVEGYTFSL